MTPRGMRQRNVKPCPGWAAYKRHIRHREVPCEACRQFVNDATNAYRRAARLTATVTATAAADTSGQEATS